MILIIVDFNFILVLWACLCFFPYHVHRSSAAINTPLPETEYKSRPEQVRNFSNYYTGSCSNHFQVTDKNNGESKSAHSSCAFYLVVPLAEEFESLGSLVHKDSVQMTRLHGADLYGFLTPAHDLIRMDIGWKRGNTREACVTMEKHIENPQLKDVENISLESITQNIQQHNVESGFTGLNSGSFYSVIPLTAT